MPRVSNTAPPRLLDVDVGMLSFDPKVGVLKMETDDGPLELAINRNVAALLAGTLVDFLAADDSDPVNDEPANDQ
jgi:hypothetical protein